MSHGQTIAKNAAWLMAATAGQKAIAFLAFYVIARLSGPEVTGKYFFAVAVTSVFVVITDLGLTPVVIREMAADENRGRVLLGRALRAKALLIPCAVIVSLAYAWLSHVSHELLSAIVIACGVMSADALSLVWYGAIRGRRQLRFEAIGMFTGQMLTATLGIGSTFFLRGNVQALVVALLIGSLWNVGWSLRQAQRLGLSPLADDPSHAWWPLMRAAMPFALAGIFVKVYSYVDTLLLKHFHSAVEIGHYAVAYKITYAFQFLPLTFVAALYPGMSSAHAADDREGLRTVFAGALRLMMLVSVPIAAGLSALSPWLPRLYGRAYAGSIAPLTVLAWVLIPIFLDFPVGSLLNATHRAAKKTTAMGAAMVVNIVMNVLLVPAFGPLGAAWSGLISFTLLCVIGFWFTRRDFLSLPWLASLLLRGALAASLIWMFTRFAMAHLSAWFVFPLTGIVMVVIVFGMRLLLLDDLRLIRSWLKPDRV